MFKEVLDVEIHLCYEIKSRNSDFSLKIEKVSP